MLQLRSIFSIRLKCVYKKFGVVGYDPVDFPPAEAQHGRSIVYRPHEYLHTGAVHVLDQLPVHERLVSNHIINRQFWPTGELRCSLANDSNRDGWVADFQVHYHIWNER